MKQERVSWLRYFFSKTFYKQLGLIGITMGLGLLVLLFCLRLYTHHGETIEMPDFSGIQINEVDSLMEANTLRYLVIDSIFNETKEPGSIVEQDPVAGAHVKENRRIYLTIIAKRKKEVPMPRLIDLSLRRAIVKLNTLGLEVGELSYVPDMAKNAVLKQTVNGEKVKQGTFLPTGTKVDLVLGNGLSDVKVELPLLEGLTFEDAQLVLQMSSLNIGLAVFDAAVQDSSAAVVYRQRPAAKEGRMINLGRPVDVFLKLAPDTSGLNQ